MAVETLNLTGVIRCPLVDHAGDKIGRVQDIIVRLGERTHPPVVGAVVKIGGRDLFVPISKITNMVSGRVIFDGTRVDLRLFERRPGELLLAKDLLARHIINVVGGRIMRANEIGLAQVNGIWEVVGVEPSSRSAFRRLLPSSLRRRIKPGAFVDWASIEPFVSHVPTSRLLIPYRKLAHLHPAQVADIVEAATHDEGEEIIEAVKVDSEFEADVFEELNTEHQLEFVKSRSDADAARLLGRMAPDDAADLLMELDQERRMPVLELLPYLQKRKVRMLLSYNPETAGGLMSPDFLSLSENATVGDALTAVRRSSAPLETLNVVFVLDSSGSVTGSVTAVSLIRANQDELLSSVARPIPAHVHANWDLQALVRKMSDFNLTVAPVMDDEHSTIIGVVTVDDVLELLIPSGWRRDVGLAKVDE